VSSFKKFWPKTDLTLVQAHELFVALLVCWQARPTTVSLVIGAGLSLGGLALRIWTSGYPRPWQSFAVYGPYRFARHPYHLGSFLALIGFCLAGRSAWVTGIMLAGTGLIFRSIMREEEVTQDRIGGPAFRDYRTQVSSLLPNLVPYPVSHGYNHTFSLSYALLKGERRELDSFVLLMVGYGLLYGITQLQNAAVVQMWLAGFLAFGLALRFFWPYIRQQVHE